MADPWINWNWLKVGPLLTNDEERDQYEKDRAARNAPQQGPSMEDYRRYQQQVAQSSTPADVSSIPYNINSPQGAADRATAPVTTGNMPADQPLPQNFDDWTWGQYLGQLYSGNLDAIDKARGTGNNETVPAQTNITLPTDLPQNVPTPTPRPTNDETIPAQTVIPDDQTNAIPLDPLESIRQQKAMVDAIYPQRPSQDIGQSAIDDEVAKDRQRTQYLAQLALFSGITQSAGGQWEGVGRGLASAGQAYSAGFDRYQKALTNRASRMQSNANAQYADESNRADAAVKLYASQGARDEKARTNARLEEKEKQNNIDVYFKQRLGLAKGTDLNPQDPAAVDQILKEWRMSRDRGEIVSSTDVSDK